MLIVGLTGSIGMGKSNAARHLMSKGIPVFDADAEVHRLYEGDAAPAVEAAFPGTVVAGRVDRRRLGQAVIGNPSAVARLESIVHPLVRQAEQAFLRRCAESGAYMAVLEVPLLYETGLDRLVDATIVLTAPPDVQRARVLQREGMSPAKLDGLLTHQMPDAEKRARADHVVDTSGPVESTARRLDEIVESLKKRPAGALALWLDDGPAGKPGTPG
jgi:dephospho-CoA kinase